MIGAPEILVGQYHLGPNGMPDFCGISPCFTFLTSSVLMCLRVLFKKIKQDKKLLTQIFGLPIVIWQI